MFSSSARSAIRPTASSAVWGSVACRATLLSDFTSCTRPSAAARTVSCGDDFAMVENCLGSSSPSRASAASASVSDGAVAMATSWSAMWRRRSGSRSARASLASTATSATRFTAAVRTRTSSSAAASSSRVPRCSGSSGISPTAPARTAGSVCFHLGCGLNLSRKDIGSLAVHESRRANYGAGNSPFRDSGLV